MGENKLLTDNSVGGGDLNHWGGYDTGMPYVTGLMLDIVERLTFGN